MNNFLKDMPMWSTAIAIMVTVLVKGIIDLYEFTKTRNKVLEAEKEAFKSAPEAFASQINELKDSQTTLEQQANQLSELIRTSQAALQVGNLFDLYSKQIEKYQTVTQARAGWSFFFAIFSMIIGLGFVVFGGAYMLTNPSWELATVAAAIAGIGGSIGAFITKTFLDVHRLSLSQLNHYFRQPVLNAHILTAQRLADQIGDNMAKQKAYEQILTNVVVLIREDSDSQQVWTPQSITSKTTTSPVNQESSGSE
jgi:hypothetical protein